MNIQKGINCYFTVDAFFTIIKEINQSINHDSIQIHL